MQYPHELFTGGPVGTCHRGSVHQTYREHHMRQRQTPQTQKWIRCELQHVVSTIRKGTPLHLSTTQQIPPSPLSPSLLPCHSHIEDGRNTPVSPPSRHWRSSTKCAAISDSSKMIRTPRRTLPSEQIWHVRNPTLIRPGGGQWYTCHDQVRWDDAASPCGRQHTVVIIDELEKEARRSVHAIATVGCSVDHRVFTIADPLSGRNKLKRSSVSLVCMC